MAHLLKRLIRFLLCLTLLLNLTTFAEGILRIPLHSVRVNFNPATVQDLSSLWVTRQITCQLLTLNSSRLAFEAAQSISYVNPTQIDIQIKPNLHFSDGSNLTAQDVIASYQYLKDNRQEFKNLYQWIIEMKQVGRYQIKILLKKPIPQFLRILAAPHSPIFKATFLKAAAKDPELWRRPISCGDYKVVQNNAAGVRLKPVAQGLPIEFTFDPQNQLTVAELKHYDLDDVTIQGTPALIAGYQTLKIFNPYEVYLGLNTHKKPWRKRANRCAFLAKLDPKKVEEAYGSRAKLATDLLPSGVLGYRNSEHEQQAFYQSFSKQQPPPMGSVCLSFLDVSIPKAKQAAFVEMIQSVYPSVKTHNITNVSHFGSAFLKSQCDFYALGFEASTLDGYGLLDMYTRSPENFTGFSNHSVDVALHESQNTIDPMIKYQQYRAVVGKIQHACVVLPILLMPYRYVYISDQIKAPGLGSVRLENYRLVNVHFVNNKPSKNRGV